MPRACSACVEFLARHCGLDVAARDSKRRTPLHVAVSGHHTAAVRWLLEVGASPKAADVDGKTPLLIAGSLPADDPLRLLFANNAALPLAPSAPVVLTAAAASAARAGADAAGAGGDPVDSPAALPPPGHGVAHNAVFLHWETPPLPPAGQALAEFQVQHSAKWTIGWVDAAIATAPPADAPAGSSSAGSSVSTAHCAACIVGLAPATTYAFRARARNANGWGPWSAKSDDVVTAPAPPPAAAVAAASAASAASASASHAHARGGGAGPSGPTTLPSAAVEAASAGDIDALAGLAAAAAAASSASGAAEGGASGAPSSPALLRMVDDVHWRSVLHYACASGMPCSLGPCAPACTPLPAAPFSYCRPRGPRICRAVGDRTGGQHRSAGPPRRDAAAPRRCRGCARARHARPSLAHRASSPSPTPLQATSASLSAWLLRALTRAPATGRASPRSTTRL